MVKGKYTSVATLLYPSPFFLEKTFLSHPKGRKLPGVGSAGSLEIKDSLLATTLEKIFPTP